MGAEYSATVYDPREFHYRARQLTELWKRGKIYEYRRDSQSFIKECREAILRQASTAPLSWNWIKCMHDLVVVHHRRGDSKNEILVADENLLLSLYTQYSPADTDFNYYLHKKHTISSDIHKRRAFQAAREDRLGPAAEQMLEAVRAAQQAIRAARGIDELTWRPPKEPKQKAATKHLRYLEYYAAILKLVASERSENFVRARTALKSVRSVVDQPDRPKRLFPDYIWDEADLHTYDHLINAHEFLVSRRWGGAVLEYDQWLLSQNKSHRDRFRFKNVKVRRHLAAVLEHLNMRCPGCDGCRASSDHLQQLAQDTRIGDAGRHLARKAAAWHQAQTVNVDAAFADVQEFVPIWEYHWESASSASQSDVRERDFARLPSHFTSLPKEAKYLAANDVPVATISRFVTQRLEDFVKTCCEYEEGHVEHHHGQMAEPLERLAERIVDARVQYRPKGALGKGADSWRSAAMDLRGIEQVGYPDVLDRYYSVLMKVAGLFPSIVRVKTQNKVGSGHWTSEIETLDGDVVSIESEFELEGPLGYLSVRGSPILLKRKDWAAWIPAHEPQWFEIQSIPLWQGDVSRIGKDLECQFLDYKQRLPKHDVGKHLCAFANSMGGFLVFGIKDLKDRDTLDLAGIKGLTPTEATDVLDHVSKNAYPGLKPPVPSHFSRIHPDGVNLVVLCRVKASDLAPHTWKGRVYIRVGSQSIPIDETKWRRWEDFAASSSITFRRFQ